MTRMGFFFHFPPPPFFRLGGGRWLMIGSNGDGYFRPWSAIAGMGDVRVPHSGRKRGRRRAGASALPNVCTGARMSRYGMFQPWQVWEIVAQSFGGGLPGSKTSALVFEAEGDLTPVGRGEYCGWSAILQPCSDPCRYPATGPGSARLIISIYVVDYHR